jgi:hypothetical protein
VGVTLGHGRARPAHHPIIVVSLTPSRSRTVAAVCRASWSLPSRTPASTRSSFQRVQSVRGLMGSPVSVAKTQSRSVQMLPACRRSWFCAARWARQPDVASPGARLGRVGVRPVRDAVGAVAGVLPAAGPVAAVAVSRA